MLCNNVNTYSQHNDISVFSYFAQSLAKIVNFRVLTVIRNDHF